MKSVPVIGAIKSALSVAALSLALAGCVASGPQAKDYSDFRTENPKSILVLPALNNSGAVEAPEFSCLRFLSHLLSVDTMCFRRIW